MMKPNEFKDFRVLEETPFITKSKYIENYGKKLLTSDFLIIADRFIPIFQYNIISGELYKVIPKAKKHLKEKPDHEIVEWFFKPNIMLNKKVPADFIYKEPQRIESIFKNIKKRNRLLNCK